MTTTTYKFKSKAGTFLLWAFFGAFGGHRFYLGNTGLGFLYMMICVATFVVDPVLWLAFMAYLFGEIIYLMTRPREYFRRVHLETFDSRAPEVI